MRTVFLAAGVALVATCLTAQTVSDAAISECQAINGSFTAMSDCLPETDIAISMMEAVASPEHYGAAGAVIVAEMPGHQRNVAIGVGLREGGNIGRRRSPRARRFT